MSALPPEKSGVDFSDQEISFLPRVRFLVTRGDVGDDGDGVAIGIPLALASRMQLGLPQVGASVPSATGNVFPQMGHVLVVSIVCCLVIAIYLPYPNRIDRLRVAASQQVPQGF